MSEVNVRDRRLRAVACGLLGSRVDMDGALQQAHLQAYRALPTFRGEPAFGAWLAVVVRRFASTSCDGAVVNGTAGRPTADRHRT